MFDADDNPGAPRILFVGRGDSSHTRSWIELLDGSGYNVRLFCVPNSGPPARDWRVRAYVTSPKHPGRSDATRRHLYRTSGPAGRLQRAYSAYAFGGADAYAGRMLAEAMREWPPSIVQTLGMMGGGYFFNRARTANSLPRAPWVLQLWGGADLELDRFDPAKRSIIEHILATADQIFDDNPRNLALALELGANDAQIASIGLVPGAGGIDCDALALRATLPPSRRRVLLWPKAYDSPWGKSLPILEGIRVALDQTDGFEVRALAACTETRTWIDRLSPSIRNRIDVRGMVPRDEVLEAMAAARVMLAPSLVDGTPNVLLEAMASGALPIVSPIPSITSMVEHERNVLFARNLYPEEIAAAIVRGMSDDPLVESVAAANAPLVRAFADRDGVRRRVLAYYRELIGQRA